MNNNTAYRLNSEEPDVVIEALNEAIGAYDSLPDFQRAPKTDSPDIISPLTSGNPDVVHSGLTAAIKAYEAEPNLPAASKNNGLPFKTVADAAKMSEPSPNTTPEAGG